MSGNNTTPPKKPRGFRPGTPKPPGSGSVKGQKYAKTIKRENAHADLMQEVSAYSKKYGGMTAAEIMEEMAFDPVVYSIVLVRDENTKPETKAKLVQMLAGKVHADKKEIKSENENTFIITMGGEMEQLFGNDPKTALLDHEGENEAAPLTIVDADYEVVDTDKS